jgi:hypothetical protein
MILVPVRGGGAADLARRDMRECHQSHRLMCCLAGALLIALVAGTESRSQGMIIVRDAQAVQPPVEGAEEEDEGNENAVERLAIPNFVMDDNQFDQWVFGGPMNSGAARRNRLESLLTLQVDHVARACNLSEIQKRKLVLAGKGDIKRFLDKVDEKRKKFEKVKTDQNKINEIYQELQPLQVALNSGLFNEGSLFSKTLKNTLEGEAATRFEKVANEKRRFRYHAKVELAVAQLDQSVGFSDEQRSKLVDVIMSETRPPARYGQYDYWVVMYQAGRIPESKVRPQFDDKQWALLKRQFDQMRGMGNWLRSAGMLPDQAEAPDFAAGFIEALNARPARNRPARDKELPENVFAPVPEGASGEKSVLSGSVITTRGKPVP